MIESLKNGEEERYYSNRHPFDFWRRFSGPPRTNEDKDGSRKKRVFLLVQTTELKYSLPYSLKRKRLCSSATERNERFEQPKLLVNISSSSQLESFIGGSKISKSHIKSLPKKRINKSGVILTREDTYCYPTLDQLDEMTQENGTCIVNGFEVGHFGLGRIVFMGKIDVARLNVDECVRFDPMRLHLIGIEGFKFQENHKAQAYVLLYGVWPLVETGEIVQNVNSIYSMQFEQRLRRACEADNTTFINYEPQKGSWSFIVDFGISGRDRRNTGGDVEVETLFLTKERMK